MNAMATTGLGAEGGLGEEERRDELAFKAIETEEVDEKRDDQKEKGEEEEEEERTEAKEAGGSYSIDVEEHTLIQDTTVVKTFVSGVLDEKEATVTSTTFNRTFELDEEGMRSYVAMEETQAMKVEHSQEEGRGSSLYDEENVERNEEITQMETSLKEEANEREEMNEIEDDAAVDGPIDLTVDESKKAEDSDQGQAAAVWSAEEGSQDTETKAQATNAVDPSEEENGVEIKQKDAAEDEPSPVASSPVRQSKRLTPANSKKRKASPISQFSPHLRRSPRVKQKVSSSSSPDQIVPNDVVVAPFDRDNGQKSSSPATPSIICKYCGKELTMSRGRAAKHLKDCQKKVAEAQEMDEEEDKALVIKMENSAGFSLVDVMGSVKLADKVQGAFQRVAFAGDAPLSRFQALLRDDLTGLCHLNVVHLLESVRPVDGPILQLNMKQPGVQRTTSYDLVTPVSKAKARWLEQCPLRFPAPRKVANELIEPLAKELGLEYAMEQHTATLTSCPVEGSVLDWRFHRTETVVVHLNGKAKWRMKKSLVEYPRRCFHPESWLMEDMVDLTKVHWLATALEKRRGGCLNTPDETFDEFDDRNEEKECGFLLKPGSVAYIPAGTWFEVETQSCNALWIEIQLVSKTYEEFAFLALKQLAWKEKDWRKGVQLYPGNRTQLNATRNGMENCIKALGKEMMELEGEDIVPEYFGTEDMKDLVARGLIRETSISPRSKRIEVDLTNRKFKLKHEKVFKDSAYRVNPVAVLMHVGEIPHFKEEMEVMGTIDTKMENSHRALKRTPKPKLKQHQAVTQKGKSTYFLEEMFGNEAFQSQLQVKFHCSAEQANMVEWIRSRASAPFELNDLLNCDRQELEAARREENARNLLRFLRFVGYVTLVKAS